MNDFERRFDDLPDDMVTEVLSHLPANDLLQIESVSRSFQRSVHRLLNRVELIGFSNPDVTPTCSHTKKAQQCLQRRVVSVNSRLFESDDYRDYIYEIDSKTALSMVRLLVRCKRVKCLDLRCVRVASIDGLMRMIDSCPEIECLCLWQVDSTYYKWRHFADLVGPRLRHLSISREFQLPPDRLEVLTAASDRLDLCFLECHGDEMRKILALNRLNPRTALSLNIHGPGFGNVQRVVEVIKRAESLTVEYSALQSIAGYCNQLERLRHLNVVDGYADVVNSASITFPELETLKLDDFDIDNFDLLVAYRFPKLRVLHMNSYDDIGEDEFVKLFDKVKHLKELILEDASASPAPRNSLTTLNQLEAMNFIMQIDEDDELPTVIGMFEALARIKTLKKVMVGLQFVEYCSVPRKVKKQLVSAIADVKKSVPEADLEVELVFDSEFFDKNKRQFNDWNKTLNEPKEVKRVQMVKEIEQHLFESIDIVKFVVSL